MSLVLVLSVFLLMTAGVYLLLGRETFTCIVGVALLGHAVNLLVVAAGRVRAAPPLLPPELQVPAGIADPVPQALVLTAIVISMAVTLYLIAAMTATAVGDDIATVEPPPPGEGEPR